MKYDNSKNGIILLLIIIIIILVTFIVLFASGVISFNVNKENPDNGNNKENIEEVEDNKEGVFVFDITYKDEVYTTTNDNGVLVAKSTRNLPVIVNKSNQSSVDKIVSTLTRFSDVDWNGIKKNSDELKDSPFEGIGVNNLFSTGVVNENRLTFILTMSGSFGGVSWDDIKGYNFDAKTGELLTFDNISLDKENFKNVLYNKVINYIENNYDTTTFLNRDCSGNGCVDVTWQELVSKYLNNEGIWYFTDTGITVKFPKHSLADGATGIISVDINKNDINSYLKDEYKI